MWSLGNGEDQKYYQKVDRWKILFQIYGDGFQFQYLLKSTASIHFYTSKPFLYIYLLLRLSMKIKGGINLDDADSPAKYEKANLNDAARHRTNTEKDMDNMFFNAPVRRSRPSNKPEEVKQTQLKKQKESPKITKHPVTVSDGSEKKASRVEKQLITKMSEKSEKSSNASTYMKKEEKVKTVPARGSKITEVTIPNEELAVEIGSRLKNSFPMIKKGSYNRPSYIRKLKKVSENFRYQEQNEKNHKIQGVLRPSQCNKKRALKVEDQYFKDSQFPPVSLSIGKSYRKMQADWKRPDQIFKKPVFGRYIDPNDLEMGVMSSPEFVSTLACLAERQQNVQRLIENQKLKSSGFYYVRLNINGVWRYVVVDDHLPFIDNEMAGVRSFKDSQSDLWASFIEKAYAKAYSGYETFSSQMPPEHYLRDLTGSVIQKYPVSAQIVNVVKEALLKNRIVMAVPSDKIGKIGLEKRFCLNVLGMDNKKFQFRNSWGTTVDKPKIVLSREGVFDLSIADAEGYIDYILIAETDDRQFTSTIQSTHRKGFYECFNFYVDIGGKSKISVSQWDEQLFPSHINYKYSPFRVLLQRKTETEKNEFICSNFTYDKRNLDIEVDLEEGDYALYCAGEWNSNVCHYNLTYRGRDMIQFERVKIKYYPNLICGCLEDFNIEHGKSYSKGSVNQYLMYHAESNLILLTVKNVQTKPTTYKQDLRKINFNSLSLLTTADPNQNLSNSSINEIQEMKKNENNERLWPVTLQPTESFTWVISTDEDYHVGNLRKWGFR